MHKCFFSHLYIRELSAFLALITNFQNFLSILFSENPFFLF